MAISNVVTHHKSVRYDSTRKSGQRETKQKQITVSVCPCVCVLYWFWSVCASCSVKYHPRSNCCSFAAGVCVCVCATVFPCELCTHTQTERHTIPVQFNWFLFSIYNLLFVLLLLVLVSPQVQDCVRYTLTTIYRRRNTKWILLQWERTSLHEPSERDACVAVSVSVAVCVCVQETEKLK